MQQKIIQLVNQAHNWQWTTEIKLNKVNTFVNNHVTNIKDKSDYWQAPHQTIARGAGDCEDIAILKAHLLRKMGLKPRLAYCTFRYAPHHGAHVICEVNNQVLDVRLVNPLVQPTQQRDDLKIDFYFNHHSLWAGGQVYKMAKINFPRFKNMLSRKRMVG